MTRTAHLRETNTKLVAKLKVYENAILAIQSDMPSYETLEHLKILGLSPESRQAKLFKESSNGSTHGEYFSSPDPDNQVSVGQGKQPSHISNASAFVSSPSHSKDFVYDKQGLKGFDPVCPTPSLDSASYHFLGTEPWSQVCQLPLDDLDTSAAVTAGRLVSRSPWLSSSDPSELYSSSELGQIPSVPLHRPARPRLGPDAEGSTGHKQDSARYLPKLQDPEGIMNYRDGSVPPSDDQQQSAGDWSRTNAGNNGYGIRSGADQFYSEANVNQPFGAGYDPNNGRVSDSQDGWHYALVVRDSQKLTPTTDLPDNNYDDIWYQRSSHMEPYEDGQVWSLSEELQSAPLDLGSQSSASSPVLAAPQAAGVPFYYPTGTVRKFGNLPMSSAISANHYPSATQRRQMLNVRVMEHTIPPLLVDEDSPMSRIYVSYKESVLELIGNSASMLGLLENPDAVYVDTFLNGRTSHDPSNVSSWACGLMNVLLDFDFHLQLAWIGMLTRFMRWIINPTAENYAKIPTMMRPGKGQRILPHSPAIDLCPHPAMREMLMRHYRDWLSPMRSCESAVSCWTEGLGAAYEMETSSGRFRLTADFERHTQILSNWTFNHTISNAFPEAEASGVVIR
ncbi:hypothetical protein AAFC00_000033 [Neodothiora populina]